MLGLWAAAAGQNCESRSAIRAALSATSGGRTECLLQSGKAKRQESDDDRDVRSDVCDGAITTTVAMRILMLQTKKRKQKKKQEEEAEEDDEEKQEEKVEPKARRSKSKAKHKRRKKRAADRPHKA